MDRPVVAVIGLGHAGLRLLCSLLAADAFDFLVVEPKTFFFDPLKVVYALTCEEDASSTVAYSLESLAHDPHVHFIHGNLTLLTEEMLRVTLPCMSHSFFPRQGGNVINAEGRIPDSIARWGLQHVVIATGLPRSLRPRLTPDLTRLKFKDVLADLKARIGAVSRVAVVGGGPTACELAGCLRQAGKEVALIARSKILHAWQGSFAADVKRELQAVGVELLEDAEVVRFPPPEELEIFPDFRFLGAASVELETPTGPLYIHDVHLLVECFDNTKPNVFGRGFRIAVDAYFRAPEFGAEVFAIGGCAAIEADIVALAADQAEHLARNLKTGRLRPYSKHPTPPAAVFLGHKTVYSAKRSSKHMHLKSQAELARLLPARRSSVSRRVSIVGRRRSSVASRRRSVAGRRRSVSKGKGC